MAWDDAVNHSAMILGAKIEYGYATTSSGEIEVPTKMTKLFAAMFTYFAAPGADTRMYCDLTITSYAVTFDDSAILAKKFSYVLIGH